MTESSDEAFLIKRWRATAIDETADAADADCRTRLAEIDQAAASAPSGGWRAWIGARQWPAISR